MLHLLFPPKCVLCKTLLSKEETDLCHRCRENAPIFKRTERNIPFVAHWTALWYYKDMVRPSLHRFKFSARRNYAEIYARLLAIKLDNRLPEDVDVLTWVPVSRLRKLKRGYDQSSLLAQALGKELSLPTMMLLKKIRHTPPQSGFRDAARRKANVLGAYQAIHPDEISGKTILLVDDVVTTGATASECAKILMTAGAKQVLFSAVAAVQNNK